MRHIIVGTAGHVDHGKTALIKALSGFEGDSTEEERRRGITIDLSFCNIQNSETNIAFIDVPGHEKLVKNMIAGAFGFDASMIVVDAREGVMPQTHEHLEILNLLGISNIIIVLTKSDLVEPDTIQKRISELEEYLRAFCNINVIKIIPTSIYNTHSIEELKEILFALPEVKHRKNGLFRYYIDRSFSIQGAGSVVTGTVLDGEVKVGDKVTVAELDREVQVRNIQLHEHDVDVATASQRAALNIQSAKVSLEKGQLLTKKGFLRGFCSIDVWCETISEHEMRHNSTAIFFVGTKQVECKVLLYDDKKQMEKGFVKLRFKEKIFLVFDEPFLLSLSGRVIAGGRVINPIDDPIKKRFKLPLLEALRLKNFKEAFEILVTTHKRGFGLISSNQRFGLSHDEALRITKELENIFVDEKELVLYPTEIKTELSKIIADIYSKNQYALLSAKSLSLKTKWASESLVENILQQMQKDGVLTLNQGIYRNAHIVIDDMEVIVSDGIYDNLYLDGITPKAPCTLYENLDLDRKMGDDALKKLTKSRRVVRLTHNLFVTYEKLTILMGQLKAIIKDEGYIEVANFKKHFPHLSRKYLIAYLEYLDKQSGIKKEGNRRYFDFAYFRLNGKYDQAKMPSL